MRDSFTVYRNTLDALETLPPEIAIKILSYMGRYAMDDVLPEDADPIASAFFSQIKPVIDKSKKRSEAGQKGGEANAKQNEANVKQTEANESKQEANASINKKKENRKEKEETEKGETVNDSILSDGSHLYQYKQIIDYLNLKADTQYKYASKDTRSHIKARLDQGFTFEDFCTVIDKKVAEWKGTEYEKYLRPSTLFGTKFEGYLNQHTAKKDRYAVVDEWYQRYGNDT